jgi:hypothetical protein
VALALGCFADHRLRLSCRERGDRSASIGGHGSRHALRQDFQVSILPAARERIAAAAWNLASLFGLDASPFVPRANGRAGHSSSRSTGPCGPGRSRAQAAPARGPASLVMADTSGFTLARRPAET